MPHFSNDFCKFSLLPFRVFSFHFLVYRCSEHEKGCSRSFSHVSFSHSKMIQMISACSFFSHFSFINISFLVLHFCLIKTDSTDKYKMETVNNSNQLQIPLQRKLFNENNPPVLYQSLKENQHQYHEPSQAVLIAEIESLQHRFRKAKLENQSLIQQTEKNRKEKIIIQDQRRRDHNQLLMLQELNVKQEGKIRQQQEKILMLEEENEKWKSYRLSQQDEARREARKYKELTVQLEEQYKTIVKQLQQQLRGKQVVLEEAQMVCQQLKKEMFDRENSYSFEIQKQKNILNKAMDEMEAQFRSMMKDCEGQVSKKQYQLQIQRKEVDRLGLELQKETFRVNQEISAKKEAQRRVQQLLIELRNLQNEVQKVQNVSRRQSQSTRAIISQAQEEIKARYEKSIEGKVLQIQRLKLQLQEETRATSSLARQFETKQNSLKTLQRQLAEKNDRVEYLQKMVQSYEGEVRSYKKNKEELLLEVNRQRQDKSMIQKLEKELTREKNRNLSLENEISKGQTLVQQWKEKYKQLVAGKDKHLSVASLREKELKDQIKELEKVIQDRLRSSERLQSQCQKFEKELLAGVERQKMLRKEREDLKAEIANITSKCGNIQKLRGQEKEYIHTLLTQKNQRTCEVSSLKKYIQDLLYQQEKHLQRIQELQRKNLYLASEKEEKRRQIQLLLEKLDQYNSENLSKTAKQQVEETKKAFRFSALQKIAKIAGIPLIEEEQAIKGITDWAYSLSVKYEGAQEQVREYKRLVLKLKEENQTLSQKYLKYKGIVLEYKQKRDKEKLLIKNSYRFNEEVLTHCQNIIKGAPK